VDIIRGIVKRWMKLKLKKILRKNLIWMMTVTSQQRKGALEQQHNLSNADITLTILEEGPVTITMEFVHLRKVVVDLLDLRDLMVSLVPLVYMDLLVGLDPKDHLDRRDDEELLDHQENQDYQETMSTHIVLYQEAREIEEHQANRAFQDDQDVLDLLDLREMLAYLLMVLLVNQVNLECLEKMVKMGDLDCQVDQAIKVPQEKETSPRISSIDNMLY